MEVLHDEEPEMTELAPGSDFHFIFIVDRSGSMGGCGRMESAKDALKIFIRSLPTGCTFSVCSFGTMITWMNLNGQERMEYNQAT